MTVTSNDHKLSTRLDENEESVAQVSSDIDNFRDERNGPKHAEILELFFPACQNEGAALHSRTVL